MYDIYFIFYFYNNIYYSDISFKADETDPIKGKTLFFQKTYQNMPTVLLILNNHGTIFIYLLLYQNIVQKLHSCFFVFQLILF